MEFFQIDGKEFTIYGRFLRKLALRDDIVGVVEDPEKIIAHCRREKIPADLMTFSQKIPHLAPQFSYTMDLDPIAAVPVSSYENWLMKQVHPNTRNKIKRAEKKGVTVKVEPLSRRVAEGIAEIFNETPVRRGRKYTSFGRTAEMVEKEWSRDAGRNEFLVAYYQEEIIGFIQLVYASNFARTSGTVAKISHRDKSPMNALFAKAVEVCASKGIPYLIYGRYEYGNKGEDSLSVFKRNNGFRRYDMPQYFIPLSIRGRMAIRAGVHNGISAAMPRGLLHLLIKARSRWYEGRLFGGLLRNSERNPVRETRA